MASNRPKRRLIPPLKLRFNVGNLPMSNNLYTLVGFEGSDETGIPPNNWLFKKNNKHYCWWPTHYSTSEVRKAVRDAEKPDPLTWEKYTVTTYYEGSYKACARKEETLIDEGSSALAHEEVTKKHKKKGTSINQGGPSTPNQVMNNQEDDMRPVPSSKSSKRQTDDSQPPSKKKKKKNRHHSPETHVQAAAVNPNADNPAPIEVNVNIREVVDGNAGQSDAEEDEEDDGAEEDDGGEPVVEVPEFEQPEPVEPGINEPNQCRSCQHAQNCPTCKFKEAANRKFQLKVLRTLFQLRMDIQATHQARVMRVEPMKIGDIQIPLQTLEDIQALEQLMTPEVIQKMKDNLRNYKDDKLWDTALQMMRSIFTVRVMRSLNWEGRHRGKQGLLKLAPVLTKTILDGAKEAVGQQWTMKQVKEKLMRVLVKAPRLPLDRVIEPNVSDAPPQDDLLEDNGPHVPGPEVNVDP